MLIPFHLKQEIYDSLPDVKTLGEGVYRGEQSGDVFKYDNKYYKTLKMTSPGWVNGRVLQIIHGCEV